MVAVVGAGISVLPPSGLPSWWGFNNALFDAIRARARARAPAAADIIDNLSLEGRIPVVAFSDLVVQSFAGTGYFALLKVLESAEPNANHRALSTLVSQGAISDVVTPNFDTLLERAFRERHVPLRVLVRPGDYERLEAATSHTPRLHKIHGSVTDEASLIDTVRQKTTGLSAVVRESLAALFRARHVLLLGFSGADFAFDDNYLPMQANAEGGHGFTWVYRDGTEPPAIARQLAANGRGELVPAALPAIFTELGVEPDETGEPAAVPTDPMVAVRATIDEWLTAPHAGEWACAAVCLRLLSATGDEVGASSLEAALGKGMEEELASGKLALGAGAAARQLALSTLQCAEFEASVRWSAIELRIHEALRRMVVLAHPDGVPSHIEREHLRNVAGACNNIGLAKRRLSLPDEAGRAFQAAHDHALRARYVPMLAVTTMNLAELARVPRDVWFRRIRESRRLALASGTSQTVFETYLVEAEVLVEDGEYELAAALLSRASQLERVTIEARCLWRCASLRAELAARRGLLDEAFDGLVKASRIVTRGGWHRGPTARRLLELLGHSLEMRERVLAFSDELLSDLPEAEETKRLFELLPRDVGSRRPLFLLKVPDEAAVEAGLRYALAVAEYEQNATAVAWALERLCQLYHDRGSHERMLDLATQLEAAAEREGNPERRAAALNYRGVAHDLNGDLRGCVAAYRHALESGDAIGDSLRGSLESNLARALTQLGDHGPVIDLFQSARQRLREAQSWENYMRASMQLAQHLSRLGRPREAGALLTGDLEIAAKTPDGESKLGSLRRIIERYDAGEQLGGPYHPGEIVEPIPSREQLERHRAAASTAAQIATLAMLEEQAGEMASALHHNQVAREMYEAEGDTLGVSRCWNNLASFLAKSADLSGAIEATKRALALRPASEDLPGHLLTLSNLSDLELHAGLAEEALETALLCLEIARSLPRCWEVAACRWVQLQALVRLGRLEEAKLALPFAKDAARSTTDPRGPQLLADLAQFEQALDENAKRRLDEPAREVSANAARLITQSRQMARAGDVAGAAELLRSQRVDAEWTAVDRATLLGEQANAAVELRDVAAARALYAESARAYEEAEQPGMAWHARAMASVALSKAGPIESARGEMVSVLDACPIAQVRANLLVAYAELAFRLVAAESEDAEPIARDAMQRLEAIVQHQGLPAEAFGRAALQLARFQMLFDQNESARSTLADARRSLVSTNSPMLDRLEQIARALE